MKKPLAWTLLGAAVTALAFFFALGPGADEPRADERPAVRVAAQAPRDVALEARVETLERALALSEERLVKDERQIVNFQLFIARISSETATPAAPGRPSSRATQRVPGRETISPDALADHAAVLSIFGLPEGEGEPRNESAEEGKKRNLLQYFRQGVEVLLDASGQFVSATFGVAYVDEEAGELPPAPWQHLGVAIGMRGTEVREVLGLPPPSSTTTDGGSTTLEYADGFAVILGPPPLFEVTAIKLGR